MAEPISGPQQLSFAGTCHSGAAQKFIPTLDTDAGTSIEILPSSLNIAKTPKSVNIPTPHIAAATHESSPLASENNNLSVLFGGL